MNAPSEDTPEATLLAELRWFVRQRWAAGLILLLGVRLHAFSDGWTDRHWLIFAVGLAILVGNLAHEIVLRRARVWLADQTHQRAFAWAQVTIDLVCLTALAMLTGESLSPLLGLFVLHMIFASLLLRPPRFAPYAAWALAVALMGLALLLSGERLDTEVERIVAASWAGTLLLTVFFTSHITDALREANEALTRHQTQMIQQEKMVAVGQMAAGVAHEIANPLANMDGLLQLVARHPDRMSPETLTELREQVRRIGHIARQLKDFAHPEQLDRYPTPVSELIASATDMIRFDKRHARIRVTPEAGDEACVVRVHPQSVQQVLVNVLINALDATAECAEPSVEVRVAREPDGGCRITVSDNGHGMTPEQLALAFEPFYTTKPLGQGTGLGLSISESLVRREGGTIEMQSEPGRGTTLTIRLPRADTRPAPSASPVPDSPRDFPRAEGLGA